MNEAIDYIQAQGYEVKENNIAHITPTRFQHINPHGRLFFNLEQTQSIHGLRLLRPLKEKYD